MQNIKLSLSDILGKEYTEAVCQAQSFISGKDVLELIKTADQKVDFFPDTFRERLDELLKIVGQKVCGGLTESCGGAGTRAFDSALKKEMAPLSGMGFVRIGEDGRAYFTGKSEHYHASLGHHFPGYKLIENAKKIGICNITHNNTRGHITRILEEELIRIANGIEKGDIKNLKKALASKDSRVLNRVINLETGSLAVEASLKMMLARFYRLDETFDNPKYSGKVPVFLAMADNKGGKQANYHGTTVLTQMLRGLWPEFYKRLEASEAYVIKSVRINDIEDFRTTVEKYDSGKHKIAGFFHELVLMNYGGISLTQDFVSNSHKICHERDIPITVDEIQSCIWSPELFLFKEYNCKPDFVSIGKGFPGGQYPASKILTTSAMDSLSQFGALVTNGQEELASLAYLITMAFAEANSEHTRKTGEYYESRLFELAQKYPATIEKIEGRAHLSTIFFKDADKTTRFTGIINDEFCIDISAQTYKADCPPAALAKIPLISSLKTVDFIVEKMDKALRRIEK